MAFKGLMLHTYSALFSPFFLRKKKADIHSCTLTHTESDKIPERMKGDEVSKGGTKLPMDQGNMYTPK